MNQRDSQAGLGMTDQDLIEWLQDRKRLPGVDNGPQAADVILADMFGLRKLMRAVSTPDPNPEKLDLVLLAISLLDEPETLEEASMGEDEYRAFVQANNRLFREADRRIGLAGEFYGDYFAREDAWKQRAAGSRLSTFQRLLGWMKTQAKSIRRRLAGAAATSTCWCETIREAKGRDADHYADSHLKLVRRNPADWTFEYECPRTGIRWIMDYPESDLRGDCPSRLRVVDESAG